MQYCITNNKGKYIKLDKNGRPTIVHEEHKDAFEYSKARNLRDNLPKSMRRMNFSVEGIPEIQPQKVETEKVEVQKVESNVTTWEYEPPETVTRWIEKFGTCGDILEEARQRKEELNRELSNIDKKLSDFAHVIESTNVNMYEAWKQRKQQQELYKQRRYIKDEMIVINNVFVNNVNYIRRENIQKSVNGLKDRKYTYRIVEE